MRLAPRLVLAFGLLVVVSTGSLGLFQREQLRRERAARFDDDVRAACAGARDSALSKAEADRGLLERACKSGELVDRTLVALERGDIDERRVSLGQLVPRERAAFDLDELLLATEAGDVLGVDPLAALPRADVLRAVRGPEGHAELRGGPDPALVVRCRRGTGGASVALVGARRLEPLLAKIGNASGVTVTLGPAGAVTSDDDAARAGCTLSDRGGRSVALVAARSKRALREELARIDEAILVAVLAWTSVAFVLAVLLARSIGRPVAELAAEARKVARGEARPVGAGGSGEIRDLRAAFDTMLEDLAVTRRRLAATSRVAAWREVARRVAHEVKNPLAPIRAAVETLRRLRARDDPRFDEYFDEATRTVLDEVHRIANIVTEFTRFARLPPPRPEEVDLVEVVQHVLTLQRSAAGDARIEVETRRTPPRVRADRDQLIQVLTNVIQNAIEAGAARVVVALDRETRRGAAVIVVTDDGPGIALEIAARLFEPYATTKASGTGLGLAISQRIAIEHDGELAYAGPGPGGRGATFRLVLPIQGPPATTETPPPVDAG